MLQDGKLGESSQIKNNAKNIVLGFRNNIKRYKTYCKNKINENVRRKTDRGYQNPIS